MLDMVRVDSFCLRRGLIVQHCAYFLIHMVLLYPKNKFFVRVYQQNVLYFCRLLGFFYNIVYLQKHAKVILFWYKCNTIKCFLHNKWILIYLRIISILHMVFLELLVRVIRESAFFRVHIIGVVFLVLIMTFLENFYCVV